MRIAINTRLLLPHKLDGIGWFTAETARRMVEAHPEVDFYFFFDRKPAEEFMYGPNVHAVVLCPQARHPVLWYLFFEWSVARALKKYKIDLFLSPDGMIPLHGKTPTLAVIHDLNFEHATDNLRRSHQWYMTHFFPRFARRATRVATVSDYSRRDIAATYGIDTAKIDVVYDGAHPCYRPHSPEEQQQTRLQYADGCPYLLFVSTILRRKNLAGLLKAFDIVKEKRPSNMKLIVVGQRSWWGKELDEAYRSMQYSADVVFLGRTDAEVLASLMSAAEALVYPSFFEGFGIPILEAMYAETAVIASNTTSMPEVGSDAALYINPHSPDDIARAILALQEGGAREALIERGRQQRQQYSWHRTTSLLWGSMMKTIGENA